MIKTLLGERPNWAKPSNPLLRYHLQRTHQSLPLRGRTLRVIAWSLVLSLLALLGYSYATDWLQRPLQMPYTRDLWRMLFYPLVILQVIVGVAGLSMGVGAIGDERRHQRWDKLRATELGAKLALRTRWLTIVFHHLRGLLALIIGARAVLVLAILYDLTSIEGLYLNTLVARAVPSLSLWSGFILLSGWMTAFLLLPLTTTGVDVALGLLISARLRRRAVAVIVQILAITLRVVTMVGLVWVLVRYEAGAIALGSSSALALLGVGSAFGDWGLSLAQLTRAGEIWADVPYAIVINAGLIGVCLVQIAMMGGLLALAVRFAERNE